MGLFFLKRFATLIATLAGASVVVFLVLDILPPCDKPFVKEDGEVVIDERGNRVR